MSMEDSIFSEKTQLIWLEEIPSNEPDNHYALEVKTFEEAKRSIEAKKLFTQILCLQQNN